MKQAFAEEFVTPSGRLGYNDQTSYALAFLWDLIPAEHVEAAKRYFRRSVELTNGKIGTGFIGTPAILPALIKIGAVDLAEKLFLQLDVPGWLYQVERGATTIWERWDAIQADGTIYDPDMNSYNHYAYGAVCQWLFEGVAGFRPDAGAAGLPPHRLRADDPAAARLRAGEPRLGRRADRGGLDGRGRRGRLHASGCRRAPRACWCSARIMPSRRSTARRSTGTDGKARRRSRRASTASLPTGTGARVRRRISLCSD